MSLYRYKKYRYGVFDIIIEKIILLVFLSLTKVINDDKISEMIKMNKLKKYRKCYFIGNDKIANKLKKEKLC